MVGDDLAVLDGEEIQALEGDVASFGTKPWKRTCPSKVPEARQCTATCWPSATIERTSSRNSGIAPNSSEK